MAPATDDEPSPSSGESVQSRWLKATSDLRTMDATIAELREEIEQFQGRRRRLAAQEFALRKTVATKGKLPAGMDAEAELPPPRLEYGGSCGSNATSPETARSNGPVMFSMGEDGQAFASDNPMSRPASIEDWEQGLELIERAGVRMESKPGGSGNNKVLTRNPQVRDRAANLKAHFLMSATRSDAA
eukprot:TRINITY_DN59104_c0_g1_i1.p1 TRINITY_DN59104_c0_g1~~TRINITY_DN59104_c0_g1_i1.p1  ORF type:complete len:187 (+),score=39.81 TRINITY_DN59104_c0_g1_i1:65-625(+)